MLTFCVCKDGYMTGGHINTSYHHASAAKAKKHNLSVEILDNIDAGAINDKGVHGLAASLHISERHLRRLVQTKTGSSPLHLNQIKRLSAAKLLIIQTVLPIVDVAFIADFSSLRQFNHVFKEAFKTSPSEMRKAAAISLTNNK